MMMNEFKLFTADFWREAAARSIRTFAQTFISVVGVSSFSVWSLDWKNSIGVSLGAAVISFLMCLDRTTAVVAVEKHIVSTPSSDAGAIATFVPQQTSVGCGDSLK